MTRRILAVTARWRADQPDGLAVTVYFETPELGVHFERQLAVALLGLDRRVDWSPGDAFRHLRDIACLPEAGRDETTRRRAVGLVAWLLERGQLAVDANTGIEWHQAPASIDEPTVVAAAPPSSATLRKKKATSARAAAPRERARPAKKKSKKAARKKP